MVKLVSLLLCLLCCFCSLEAQGHDRVGKDRTSSSPERAGIQESLDQRLAELSRQITGKIEAGQKRTIAVLEFTDLQGNVTDFGRYVAEELITRLYDSSKFKVIERQLLNKVISEQKLSLTGVIDPASAKRLGNILGVDAIVSGTIADRGESLKVNARLISTETGEVFSAAAAEITKDNEVAALMRVGSPATQPDSKSLKGNTEKWTTSRVGVFRFEAERCKLMGDELTCSLSVTNESDVDRYLFVYAFLGPEKRSRALDSAGREYKVSSLWVGNNHSDSSGADSVLPPGIAVKVVLEFKLPGNDVTELSLLRFAFSDDKHTVVGNSAPRYADFRNVPIVR